MKGCLLRIQLRSDIRRQGFRFQEQSKQHNRLTIDFYEQQL